MKTIYEHCTTDDIKAKFETISKHFNFSKQKKVLSFPKVTSISNKPRRSVRIFFNINRYFSDQTNEFKRSVAEFLFTILCDTPREVIMNYTPYKEYATKGNMNKNRKYLTSALVSKHLAKTISTVRFAWIGVFIFNFHVIQSLANSLLAKEQLANDVDKMDALLGLKCHKRGVEPYFPTTAFISGEQYDYSAVRDSSKNNKDCHNKQPEDEENARQSANIQNFDTKNSLLYSCTNDCIETDKQDYNTYKGLCSSIGNANRKNIREILHSYDYCSNFPGDDIYLLPCIKRNHPKVCYDNGCEGSSVTIRKLAVHHKNCRRFINVLTDLNLANKFIHDIDVATVVGDIPYLIKLVSFHPNKKPSIYDTADSSTLDYKKQLEIPKIKEAHTEYQKDCIIKLPEHACQSCNILESTKDKKVAKDSWTHIKNASFTLLKNALNIQSFSEAKVILCKYCTDLYNKDKIPPRSILNNMNPGKLPDELKGLTPIELMFISKVKVFQTVVRLGAVGRNVPSNSRLSALKGTSIHLPLPLEQTIKQLDNDTGFLQLPSNFIMTHQIKGDEFLLRNLVDLDKVYKALVWLKYNHCEYKNIDLPERPDLLFINQVDDQSSHLDDSNTIDDVQPLETSTILHNNDKSLHLDESTPNNDVHPQETSTILHDKEQPQENNASKMINQLKDSQVQNQLEHFVVVGDSNVAENNIMNVENIYELLKIDAKPIHHTKKK